MGSSPVRVTIILERESDAFPLFLFVFIDFYRSKVQIANFR